ncbi:MAG TPA: SxtJ family membrane protein [Spongiibacteraceae bacterium]|nr:SxtJ family membrane protein [Spongiibacteraceae bacterium]
MSVNVENTRADNKARANNSAQANHNAQANNKELRKFGFLFAFILVALFEGLLPWLKNKPLPLWPLYVAVPIALLAALWPAALRPLYTGWMKFGAIAGAINTRIIMGVVFFALLTPIAWIMRGLGRDPLARRFERAAHSYRVTSAVQEKEHMEKPY